MLNLRWNLYAVFFMYRFTHITYSIQFCIYPDIIDFFKSSYVLLFIGALQKIMLCYLNLCFMWYCFCSVLWRLRISRLLCYIFKHLPPQNSFNRFKAWISASTHCILCLRLFFTNYTLLCRMHPRLWKRGSLSERKRQFKKKPFLCSEKKIYQKKNTEQFWRCCCCKSRSSR